MSMSLVLLTGFNTSISIIHLNVGDSIFPIELVNTSVNITQQMHDIHSIHEGTVKCPRQRTLSEITLLSLYIM